MLGGKSEERAFSSEGEAYAETQKNRIAKTMLGYLTLCLNCNCYKTKPETTPPLQLAAISTRSQPASCLHLQDCAVFNREGCSCNAGRAAVVRPAAGQGRAFCWLQRVRCWACTGMCSVGGVSFGHPDSSKTKGGPFERLPLIPGTPRCCLLDTGTREAAPQCRLR